MSAHRISSHDQILPVAPPLEDLSRRVVDVEHVLPRGRLRRGQRSARRTLRARSSCGLPFEIGIAFQSGHIVRDEGVRLAARDAVAFCTLRRNVARRCRRVELHVVQHFGDGVAMHDVGDDVAAILGQLHVHGVRVAEQVVQVAENLLIRAGEEDAEDVVFAVAARAARGSGARSCRRRTGRSCRRSRR